MVSPKDDIVIIFLNIIYMRCDGTVIGHIKNLYTIYLTFSYGTNSGCHGYATKFVRGSCRTFIELYRNKF
jgi:hypothetical protein